MASERAKADEENLRQTAFEKGEWARGRYLDRLASGVGAAASVKNALAAAALGYRTRRIVSRLRVSISDQTPFSEFSRRLGRAGHTSRPLVRGQTPT